MPKLFPEPLSKEPCHKIEGVGNVEANEDPLAVIRATVQTFEVGQRLSAHLSARELKEVTVTSFHVTFP
jgi:hypothetical protein